jgi:2-polyprenyl-6-methoxyphenol hydroxylase-like FAD-dependent oxidoreductase
MMRVLISGGGIAGLTLAYWLHRYGIEPVVIEQAGGMRSDGYALDFFGTGYDMAERMELIDRLQARQVPAEYAAFVNRSGEPIARLDIALMRKIMRGKYMALMRLSLEEALYEALANDVEVRFGRSLVAVQQDPEAVCATFNDGTTEPFDVLIGADGIHSNTRKLVFGPEEQFGQYLGYYSACYALPDRYGIGHAWKNYLEPGRLAGAYCSNNEGEIITLFAYRTQDEGHIPQEQRLPRLRQAFTGMGWVASKLLADALDPGSIFMDTVTQIQMPTWHQGRVALVGDACSCPTLISGQGASLAMGGAYVLAQVLHEAVDYQEAFRRYEQLVRPYVEGQQKNARGLARLFVPGSRPWLIGYQALMKLVLREPFIGLLRRQFGTESLLQARELHRYSVKDARGEKKLTVQ